MAANGPMALDTSLAPSHGGVGGGMGVNVRGGGVCWGMRVRARWGKQGMPQDGRLPRRRQAPDRKRCRGSACGGITGLPSIESGPRTMGEGHDAGGEDLEVAEQGLGLHVKHLGILPHRPHGLVGFGDAVDVLAHVLRAGACWEWMRGGGKGLV